MKYINSVMNFTGNKFKLLDQIIPEMDFSKKNFIDLFTGSGSVYINVVDKFDKIIVNDIIEDLIGIHKKLIESDKIINKTKKLAPSKDNKEEFLNLRSSYNKEKSPEKLWALMLSCTNNLMRFNKKGEFNQTFGKRSFNDNTQKKIDSLVNHIRNYKDKLIFYSKPFDKIEIYNSSFYYIDPPYGSTMDENGNICNKQITEAGYSTNWNKENDISLYDYCLKINEKNSTFMISGVLEHNNKKSWILNKLIKHGFNYKELKYDYNKVSKTKKNKNTKEIIIMNY